MVSPPHKGPMPTVGMPAWTMGLRMSLEVCSGLTTGRGPVARDGALDEPIEGVLVGRLGGADTGEPVDPRRDGAASH